MTDYSLNPIHVALSPSRLLAAVLLSACLGACIVIVLLPLAAGLTLLICLASVLATLYAVVQHAWLRLARSVTKIEVSAKGELRCMTRGGEWRTGQVLGSSFVTPWLTVLNLHLVDRRFSHNVVLMPDMLDAESFRRLRVWLRWGAVSAR